MVRSIIGRSFVAAVAALLVAIAGSAGSTGCSSDDNGSAGDGGADGITSDPGKDGSAGDDGGDSGPSVMTTFRFANVSPDLGAFDVCYRSATHTSWMGPIFAPSTLPDAGSPAWDATSDAIASDANDDALADASPADASSDGSDASSTDAAPATFGVAFATISNYVAIAGSGTFDLALVAAGETSCAHPRALGHVTLDPAKHTTVVAMGLVRADAGSEYALAVTAFTDDSTLVNDAARVRFIHGALGGGKASMLGAVSIDAVTSSITTPLAADVRPGDAATPSSVAPKIDMLGYGVIAPIGDPTSIRSTPSSDGGGVGSSTPATDLGLTTMSLHTAILFDDTDGSLAVLWCSDGGFGGPDTQCQVLTSH